MDKNEEVLIGRGSFGNVFLNEDTKIVKKVINLFKDNEFKLIENNIIEIISYYLFNYVLQNTPSSISKILNIKKIFYLQIIISLYHIFARLL